MRIKHLLACVLSLILFFRCSDPKEESFQTGIEGPILDKSLVEPPPMGWNSFDCLGINPLEEDIRANAEYMANNLKQLGYEYIVVDMGWAHDSLASDYVAFASNRVKKPNFSVDQYGRLIPNPDKYPSSRGGKGLKPLADYVHSLGLKFGIHIMRGIPWQAGDRHLKIKGTDIDAATISDSTRVCDWFYGMPGVNVNKPGGQEYYNSILELYAEWGVDYLKADDQVDRDELIALNRAVKNCGRPIILSIVGTQEKEDLKNYSHLWRVSSDFWDDWEMLKAQFRHCMEWQEYIGKDGWPDLDMLPIGKIGKYICYKGPERYSNFTPDEHYTLMSLWYIFRSPLMLGGYLTENDPFTTQLISNTEALEVNRNSTNNRFISWRNAEMVWAADIPDSEDKYVALFNIFECCPMPVHVSWKELGLAGDEYKVRDLWNQEDLGQFTNGISPMVNAHGAGLYRISSID